MLTWLLRGFRKAIPLSLLRDKALQAQTVPVKGSIRRTAGGQVAVVHPHVAQRMVGPVTGTPEQAYQRSTHIVQTAQRLKRERDWGHPLLWEDHEHKGIVQDLAKEAGYQQDDSRWKSPDDFLADRLSLIGLHKVDRHLDGTPKLSPAGAVIPVGGENELKLAIWRAATVPDDESDELRKAIEQMGLFDHVVQVHGHVRQTDHGVTFVSPHLATRKKASPVLAGEPWEIPRTAFVSQPHKLSTFNDTKISATYQATTPAGYVGFSTWWKFDGLKGKTKAKEEAERDLRKRLSAIHLDRVKAALADGLAVPAEVMTDYPDLVKPKQTATDAFKKWFRDSKVVHPDGTPLVVYHATTSEFQEFRPGGLDPRVSGPAIWFRTDPTEIRSAHNTGYNQRSMREGTAEIPAYVSIQRPLIVDNDTRDWAQVVFGKEFPYFITEQNLAVLIRDGYDGVMLYSRDPRTRAKLQEVVAFEPTQVKSAIGNAGTFDPADPNLLKARVRAYTKKDGTFVREHTDNRSSELHKDNDGKTFTHWLTFDPVHRDKIVAVLKRGSGFELKRIYGHPSKGHLYVMEVESSKPYKDLDLDVNSLSSPLKRVERKPAGLGNGLSIESWEGIYGPLTKGIHGGGHPLDYTTEFQGLGISIENQKGSIRRWTDRDGKTGQIKMKHAYGYIRRTQGVDGDHVDCFLGPNPDATHAYVIHSMAVPDFKEYDEDKVMLGFDSAEEAKQAFLDNYTDPRFFGSMHTIPMEAFKKKALATKDNPAMIKSLSAADRADYEEESREIRERAKKDGRRPHRFAAARWTHPNGHPRCTVCGDEERTDGRCPGKPALRLQFAKAACSPGENCRWITVHPGGSGEGQPILIRESKTDKGTYHVIGGAGGKLNYLKLTNVKSESEYKEQAAERSKKKKEQEKERAKQDKEAGTFEPKRKALGDLKEQTQQHERALIEHVAETMGWTNYDLKPEQLQGLSDSAKGLIVSKHHRQLLRDAMDVVKQTRERLLDDADARVEAQLGELSIHRTEPDVLGLTDLMPPEKDAGKGYAPRYEEKAKAAGLDEEQLAKELDELKEQRKKELPPGMAEAGERLQAAMEQIRGEVKQAEASGKVATGERTTKPAPPTKAMALLSMAKQLQQVQAQSRKKAEAIKTGKDVVAKSYVIEAKPVTSSELIAELEADAQERERQDLCKSFLKTVETPLSIESEDEHADSLDRHIQVGATNALTRASLGLTGQDVLPHDVIAVLGTAGAAQALAHAMHSNLSPEDVQAFADRLATYHQAHHVEAAQEAIARAQELSEQAREIQLGTVDSPSELAVASEMNAKRVDMLREARELLGSTLGEMEAVAALEYALQAGPVSSIRVSLGAISNDTAVKQLRALGLAKEDYTVESDGKNRYGTVLSTGIPHLTRRIDPEEAKRYEFTRAVMNGEHDEEGWSPDGFARRPQSSYTDPNEQAVSFAQPFSVSSHGIIEEDLKSYIGSQMADGVPVANIYSSLLSHDLVNQVPEDQRQAYFEAIDRIAPLRDEAGKAVRAEAHTDGFKRMAEEFVTRKFGTDAAPLHAQQIDPTAKHTFEALHRVLADDPRRMVAFKKIGELTPQDQTLLRTHFEKTFAKPEQQAMVQEKLEALGPEPAKESDGLFGVQENPEWREWQTQRQGLLESASQAGLSWDKYVELHRGREGAYAAMQDHLKSGALQAFAEQYKKVSKTPLKIGRTVMRGNISHLDAVDPQAREARLTEQRQTVDQLRNRVEGKYAAGSIKDKLDRARELAAIADQNQVSMFLAHPEDPKNPTLKADERWTLGDTIEQQLTAVLPQVARNFSPNQPVSLIPDANMDGKYVNKQRLIKLIAANKRMVASLGTGSGKTSIGLGAFTHLHSQGKVKRGLFAVPSIVQRQFAGEGATWLEPGKYSWWANAGAPREERLAAYKDPSHHFAVVTHQALRDDMVHLMAKQAGIGEDEMAERFKGLNEGQRRATLTQTLQKEGINWDYLNIDEAHDALNRQGKPDSLFSNIIDAIGMETPYYVSASADPIKNDVSELFDQLHKVDPDRYTDRGDFMAKYGINTTASRDALKRELMGRVFPGRVEPGVKAIKHDVPVALTAQQRMDYDAMMAAYRKARQARADGKVDVAALKQLSPSSFAGGDDEATGKRLNDALGTLRDTALSRVVNLAHPDHNAKMQEVMQRANQYREQGKPGLIFAHHREAVAQLTKQLKAQGHRVVTITGADSAKEKGRKQMLFHPPNGHDAEADIMVVSDAGAVGMNAQRGKWVIHYDIPHTAKTWWQRTGRIHRLGQKDDVDVVTLQTDSILDQKNKARLERKSGLREMLTSPYEGLEDSGIAASLLAPKEEKEPVAA